MPISICSKGKLARPVLTDDATRSSPAESGRRDTYAAHSRRSTRPMVTAIVNVGDDVTLHGLHICT